MPLSVSSPQTVLARSSRVSYNLSAAHLVEQAISRGEGVLTANGSLNVTTGKYTGRSPKDKLVVAEPGIRDQIDWGDVNRPMEPAVFERLYQKAIRYMEDRDLFVFSGFAGTDPRYRLPIQVINESPWQNLFVRQLFVRPTEVELAEHEPEFTVICLPNLQAIPDQDGTRSETFICLSFEHKVVLIGGTHYAGEMKKSIFTVMNYLLPQQGIFPMHCSANVGKKGDVSLFFGLSGTGKTTLSADPDRALVGDDEHGWTNEGIFNVEGGCYAKCINLSPENEPQIYDAIRFGSVLENVVVDPTTRIPDYDDDSLTENTRAAYPIEFIPNIEPTGMAGHPNTIIFLTADAFGVLPPISKLNATQAMYHFLSGYTSKLAGTERGVTSPEATFSTCFGHPFLPLPAARYAELLGQKIEKHHVSVYLLNTGWSGGPYGAGKRISLKYTRAMVNAALSGELDKVLHAPDPIFQVQVPSKCPGVPDEVLQPKLTWEDAEAYDLQARKLALRFSENFQQFSHVSAEVMQAGPKV